MQLDIREILCDKCDYTILTGTYKTLQGGIEKIEYCSAPYPIFARPAIRRAAQGFPIIGCIIAEECKMFKQKEAKDGM